MTTRYDDAWLKTSAQWYDDPDVFTVSKTGTDPEHGNTAMAPRPLMQDAPTLPEGGEIYSDIVIEWREQLPPAMPIDHTPVQGQGNPGEVGHGYGGITTPGEDIGSLAAMRGEDLGAAKRGTSSTTMFRFVTDTFFGFFSKGFEPPPISHGATGSPVFTRGINSFGHNNGQGRPWSWGTSDETTGGPGAWRRGDYEGSNVQRRFRAPHRTHDQVKMVEPDIVTIIGDAPPPDQWDPYAPQVSLLQKFLPKRRRVRGIRREAGPFDEDFQSLETVTYSPSVDGLVAQ